jgi:hypothetical protein
LRSLRYSRPTAAGMIAGPAGINHMHDPLMLKLGPRFGGAFFTRLRPPAEAWRNAERALSHRRGGRRVETRQARRAALWHKSAQRADELHIGMVEDEERERSTPADPDL